MLATVLLLANVLVIVTFWWLYRFSWSLNHRLSSRLLGHYLSQPYAFILTRNTAALANKVVVEVRHLVESGFQSGLEILTRTVVIVAIVGFLFALDPLLAVIVFAVLGLLFGAIFAASRRYLKRVGAEAVVMGGARLKALNEALGGFKDLKVTGREAFAHLQYDRPSRRFGEIQAAQNAIVRLPRYALEAVAVGGMVLIASLLVGPRRRADDHPPAPRRVRLRRPAAHARDAAALHRGRAQPLRDGVARRGRSRLPGRRCRRGRDEEPAGAASVRARHRASRRALPRTRRATSRCWTG